MASEEASNGVGVEQPTSSTSSSSSKPATTKEETFKLAVNFLLQGKRHLVIKDFQAAIESLGESCKLLAENEELPSACFENAESHFFYGKALLEQSRLELGVLEGGPELGKSEDASEEESDDEDKSGDEEEESEEAETTNEVAKSDDEAESSEAAANGVSDEDKNESNPSSEIPQESAVTSTDEANKSEGQEQEVDLNAPSPSVTSAGQVVDNEVPSTSSGLTAEAVAEKQAEEELSNLELAWEVLEVAKIGYRALLEIKQTSEETGDEEQKKLAEKEKLLKKRLADTHCSLGEVATESENYNQAIDEFKTGLEILNEIEGSDSREIAQYYFQMGLAYSFDKKFPEAITSFKKSVEIIETRISLLKHKIDNKQTAKDLGIEPEDASKTENDEVQELTALLPELQEKITDTIDAEKESKALEEEEKQEKEIILRNSPVKNPNPPAANDISHLVKKKKKADDPPVDERPVKKLCTEVESSSPNVDTDAEMKELKESVPEPAPIDQTPASTTTTTNGHPIAT